jgi:hypothetical protein
MSHIEKELVKVLNHGTCSIILDEANLAMKIKWKGTYGSRLGCLGKMGGLTQTL